MGQALYRKYRSKSLDEIVGQEHVTTTLANALKSGRISHAYLLSGPRGVGKTSIARILAHEINGLPYGEENHLDIIEIDAASNRRIDEIRDLRERVNTAPASAKYKVYIIDEVHMLTKEAFNALLKTLEEPPAHVIFILATTEAHKLPETIISRTQRYTLRPVSEEKVVAHLKDITKQEKLTIDDDALHVIAQHGEGSFRDSISLLDQASSVNDHVTKADIQGILGLAPEEYVAKLLDAIVSGTSANIVTTLTDLYSQGFEAAMIAQQLGAAIRSELLDGKSTDPAASLGLLERLLDIPAARNARQLLEIVLLQSALPKTQVVIDQPVSRPTAPAQPTRQAAPQAAPVPKPMPEIETQTPKQPEVKATTPASEDTSAVLPEKPTEPITDVTELWQQALDTIKKQYNTLYGIARMAQPEFNGERLTLAFKFAFHQKRVNEAKNRKLISDVIERLYGQPVEIECIVAEVATAEKPDVSTISNIFGGAELLES
jgi:DNA polymerase-3 subunit gamma/tau